MIDRDYNQVILEHYRKQVEQHGADSSSTMLDEITRGREVVGVHRVLEWLTARGAPPRNVLEIGCGNGYLLSTLREKFPALELSGLEYTPEMCEAARARNITSCEIVHGDVRKLPFAPGKFDCVITERCIINVMDVADQAHSLHEVARVLRPGGHFLCIEAFADGLANLNEARAELGLPPNQQPHHNIWFDKAWFERTIAGELELIDLSTERDPSLPTPNFLSSHYFISRVLYPAVTHAEVKYNTHLVKFFSFLPPMGNYSPIQFYVLRRK